MSYIDFVEKYSASVGKDVNTLLNEKPMSFPVSTNDRGEKLLGFLEGLLEINLQGKRVLDIGCAYGGFSIALAKRGAIVTGIDVSADFIDYAQANANGDVKVDFRVIDASSSQLRLNFKNNEFDIVLLNDVLEHIYDTTSLAKNIDYLLNDTGWVYFKVPNGHSPRWAISEGHRKKYGLTMLDPDCWFYLHPRRASIFYRPFEYFPALFGHFGLDNVLWVDEEEVFRRFRRKKIMSQFKEIFEIFRNSDEMKQPVRGYIQHGIKRFRDEFLYDHSHEGDTFCRFKYGSYFFTGFFGRPDANLQPKTKTITIDGVGTITARPDVNAFPDIDWG